MAESAPPNAPTNGGASQESDAPLVAAFKAYEPFCRVMLDAFALIDTQGRVLKCNPLLSQLLGVTTRQITKAGTLDDLLRMKEGSRVLNTAEFLKFVAPTRIDEVRGISNLRDDLNLIIGVYPFVSDGAVTGAFILIRDVTAETNLQGKYKNEAERSITDRLTGLYNRAYLEDYLSTTVSYLMRLPAGTGQALSLAMFDVDHFKKVNDVYGHQAGDKVLSTVGEVMRATFRKTDVLCRYGGEEFMAILPGTELPGASVAADKFRTVVASRSIVFDGKTIPVTISGGVAQISLGVEKHGQAIARADAALYHSKESGRNRITVHDGGGLRGI